MLRRQLLPDREVDQSSGLFTSNLLVALYPDYPYIRLVYIVEQTVAIQFYFFLSFLFFSFPFSFFFFSFFFFGSSP